jgi:hypothetical protein
MIAVSATPPTATVAGVAESAITVPPPNWRLRTMGFLVMIHIWGTLRPNMSARFPKQRITTYPGTSIHPNDTSL